MIMDYAFDLALLFISTCSALYCWTLSRRLRALQNLRKGVGEAMVNLTQSVTAVETNAAKLNRESMAAVSELRVMLSRVDACEDQVDLLLGTMDRQSREAWREYQERTDAAHRSLDKSFQTLAALVAQGQGVARELHSLSARSQAAQGGAQPTAALPVAIPAPAYTAPEPTPAPQPAPSPEKKAAAAPNPEKKRATRTVVSGEREMSPREIALAKLLAARRARKEKEEGEAATPAATQPKTADETVANFQKRMREARRAKRADKSASSGKAVNG